MVAAFEKASGKKVNYKIVDRRPGDLASCYANPEWAKQELGWSAKRGLEEMCK
jgi:UDP-glucose 4-epimerase